MAHDKKGGRVAGKSAEVWTAEFGALFSVCGKVIEFVKESLCREDKGRVKVCSSLYW